MSPALMSPPALLAAAPGLAGTALGTVREEFPNGLRVEYTRPGDAPHRPRDRRPAFYGSYDWHSAVEMHWVPLRLLRVAGASVPATQVEAVLDEHLTPAAIATEVVYFAGSPGAERPYGLAWALTLADEAASWAAAPGASPALTEALLMAEVLPPAEFEQWLSGFLPGLASGPLFKPGGGQRRRRRSDRAPARAEAEPGVGDAVADRDAAVR